MTKGNFLEHSQVVNMSNVKESRTEALLRQLNVTAADFLDPKLPKGFFSNSQYNSWLICGRAYEYKYVQQIATPDYVATTRGSSVHSGVEHMLRAKMAGTPSTVEAEQAVVAASFDAKARGVLDWGDEDAGKVKDLALALFKAYTTYGLAKTNPIAVEKGFAAKAGDVPMVGWIDLIDEQPAIQVPGMSTQDAAAAPKRKVIVDLKTSKAKWSENEVRLDPQLTLYAHIESTPMVRIDQLISHKSKPPTFLQAESFRTPRDVEIMVEHVGEVADLVKKGVFPKTQIDNWSCNVQHCSFWTLCRGKKT